MTGQGAGEGFPMGWGAAGVHGVEAGSGSRETEWVRRKLQGILGGLSEHLIVRMGQGDQETNGQQRKPAAFSKCLIPNVPHPSTQRHTHTVTELEEGRRLLLSSWSSETPGEELEW